MPTPGQEACFASPISAACGLRKPISKLLRIDLLCSAGVESKVSNAENRLSGLLYSVRATAHWFGCGISGFPIRRGVLIVCTGSAGVCRNSRLLRKGLSQALLAWLRSPLGVN